MTDATTSPSASTGRWLHPYALMTLLFAGMALSAPFVARGMAGYLMLFCLVLAVVFGVLTFTKYVWPGRSVVGRARRPTLRDVLIAVGGVLLGPLTIAGVFAQARLAYGTSQVRVVGRVVAAHDGAPLAGVWMMTCTSESDAEDSVWAAQRRREILERTADAPGWTPIVTTGGFTLADGTIAADVMVPWSFSTFGGVALGRSRPPPRHGIEALRIEIEGRDPMILDVPEGTRTQHDGEDGLWATWDLGVVEVPSAREPGR